MRLGRDLVTSPLLPSSTVLRRATEIGTLAEAHQAQRCTCAAQRLVLIVNEDKMEIFPSRDHV